MNKKIMAVLVALTVTFSFAQDAGMKLGARVNLGLISSTTGDDDIDDAIDIGMGFPVIGIGIVADYPLSDVLAVSGELGFQYRNMMSTSEDDGLGEKAETDATEFAINVPVMVKFSVMPELYLGAGVQLDLPISSEATTEYRGEEKTVDFPDRNALDFGIIVGAGYMVAENIGADVRFIKNLNGVADSEAMEDGSYWGLSLGVSYFF